MVPTSTPEFQADNITIKHDFRVGDGPATHGYSYVVPADSRLLTRREAILARLVSWVQGVSRPRWYFNLGKRSARRAWRAAARLWILDSDDLKLIGAVLIISVSILWAAALAGFAAGLVIRFFNLGVGA